MEWWNSLIVSLIVPFFMLVFGIICVVQGRPKNVHWWVGYRTPMSAKNKETWRFAHNYFGKISLTLSPVFIILSIGAVILTENGTITFNTLPWLGGLQLAAVLIIAILTETALRKEFNKNGERRR